MKKTITISTLHSGVAHNATPVVTEAIRELRRSGGGVLRFEMGEYHFYEEGTETKYYAISNNDSGDKRIAFSLRKMDGITIDGDDSLFVIHGKVFPFIVDNCKDVTIQNIRFDRSSSPHVLMKIREITDEGFGLEIDRNKYPFRVENGSLVFLREWGEYSGLSRLFSLHSSNRIRVRYLLTGDCTASYNNLPVAYMWADAKETEWGVRLTYRHTADAQPCLFEEGESLSVLTDGGRDTDLFFLQESEKIRIENITVRQAIGMGIIAQLCKDITIQGFRTDYDEKVCASTTTADAMHFVNCNGSLDISECHITHTEDDILNVHGIYTLLDSFSEQEIQVKIMHDQQCGVCPYRQGDRLRLIDQSTLEILGIFRVSSYAIEGDKRDRIRLSGEWEYGIDKIQKGDSILVENPDRMPDLHLHHNYFYRFPHLRISGTGRLLIEHNHIERARAAALLMDLAMYWYESGRIRDLVFRHNKLVDCNALGAPNGFIQIGVHGMDPAATPKIHERIELSDNEFIGVPQYAVTAAGVKELILKNNSTDKLEMLSVLIDGKEIEL